jgi:hypothetical protein
VLSEEKYFKEEKNLNILKLSGKKYDPNFKIYSGEVY